MAKTTKNTDSNPEADKQALDEANEQAAQESDPTAEPDGDVRPGNTLVTDETVEGLEQARRNADVPMTSEDYNQ